MQYRHFISSRGKEEGILKKNKQLRQAIFLFILMTLVFPLLAGPTTNPAKKTGVGPVSPPASFDWRNVNGCNYVSGVKDQLVSSECACCVAFATAAMLETKAMIQFNQPVDCEKKDKKPGAPVGNETNEWLYANLSETQLFFCNNNCAVFWSIPASLNYCQKHGVVPEPACISYDAVMSYCQNNHVSPCSPGTVGNFQQDCCQGGKEILKITSYQKLKDEVEIKKWLCTQGPLIATLYGDDGFIAGDFGEIYHCPNPLPANHAVCCIGYDDSKKAWLCKNSFGTNWGKMGGYFWLAYGQCGFDNVMFGIDGVITTKSIN